MASKAPAKKAAVVQPVQVYTHIHSLLYTLRAIAEREDQLCTVMHHLRTFGKLTPALAGELHEILEEIPTREYLHDIDALRASLSTVEGGGAKAQGTRSRAGSKRRAA